MDSEFRPNPDDLLEGIKKAEDKTKRGKLKVFIGMCPGVGKTYSMLLAAQEKQLHGTKVIVGVVETHKRSETERLVSGFEILPRMKIEYKGTVFEEFDLDRAIAAKPGLILVDELAHTNAPGSKHPKRYQDVKDLLVAGIDVYTTMNVQHIGSRADLVYQISGVPIRETVPDAFFELADQIELIDISPEELLQRLGEGKVYLGEKADRAAEGFFKIEKLTALRELALRFTAEIVDGQLQDHMKAKHILGPWNINERLMVAISHSPYTARLIRATRRKAFNQDAPWIALYVDSGVELENADHEMLTKNLNLARELGAEVITTKDRSIANALKRVAAEKNVTQIVMGRPDRRLLSEILGRKNILNQLVDETSEIDIHVIRQKRKPVYRGFHIKLPRLNSKPAIYGKTLAYIGILSLLGLFIQPYVGYRAIGFGFLLAILPISTVSGFGPTFMSAALTALLWDFLFIPPRFTFVVTETDDAMMILAYFAVAMVAGFLASRIKSQERDLLQRERKSNILYEFGKKLPEAKNQREIANHGATSISAIFSSNVAVFIKQDDGKLSKKPLNEFYENITEKDLAVADWSYTNQKKSGWKTDTLSSSACLCLPLTGRSGPIGVLMLYPKEDRSLTLEQENLVDTISRHLATALEREALELLSRKNEVYERSEKLHQALLNTVSHELRTPLTTILGCATALKDPQPNDPQLSRQMLSDLIEASSRLNRTVENLMDMSRLSSGVLTLDNHVFELNDFIKSFYQNQNGQFQAHPVVLDLAKEDLYISGDEKVLEHVMMNLISNAMRFSKPGSSITISTKKNHAYAEVSVTDEGRGLAPDDLNKVFDRFYRSPGSPPGGVGLGLSISKALIEAHHGAIFAENRVDRKGAVFKFILPSRVISSEALSK